MRRVLELSVLVTVIAACDSTYEPSRAEPLPPLPRAVREEEPRPASEPVPEVERVVWSGAASPEDWESLTGVGWTLRVPPGYQGSGTTFGNWTWPDRLTLRYPDATLQLSTRDAYAEAASVGARPPLSPDLVSRETCLEYLHPAAFFDRMRTAHSVLRNAAPPEGALTIAEHGERRACVFRQASAGGYHTTNILVAAPNANLWLTFYWSTDAPMLGEACETIARTWEIPPAADAVGESGGARPP